MERPAFVPRSVPTYTRSYSMWGVVFLIILIVIIIFVIYFSMMRNPHQHRVVLSGDTSTSAVATTIAPCDYGIVKSFASGVTETDQLTLVCPTNTLPYLISATYKVLGGANSTPQDVTPKLGLLLDGQKDQVISGEVVTDLYNIPDPTLTNPGVVYGSYVCV